MYSHTRLPLLILLCTCGMSSAAEPKRDRFGDPLPEGASARLGSLHMRREAAILAAAFTADGKTLATCDANSASFWDIDTGKCVRHVPFKRATGHVRGLSNDAKVLMLSGFDNVLHFIDAASGAEQHTLNHARCGPIRSLLELSRDGKILAAVHRSSIALWDVAGGKLLREFKEPSLERVASQSPIALTPDGKQLVLPHADGSLYLVDVASGKELRAFEMPPPPRQNSHPSLRFAHVALSPDGRYLAYSRLAAPVTVCELATGKRLSQLERSQGSSSRMVFTPNSRFLAVEAFKEIRLFGVLSGKEIRKLPNPAGSSYMLAFSPNGRTLAVFPMGRSTIHLWDVAAQRRLHPPAGHEAAIKALAFFPDGKRLVSADQRGEIRAWDIASAQTLAQRSYNYGPASLTVDRDGETVCFACQDSSAHQWDLRTGRERVRRRVVNRLSTNNLALSPDGRSLAILVPNGGAPQKRPATSELRLYDLKTNNSIVLPRPPGQSWIGHLTFTPDSHRLAASCADGALRLWDRDTAKLVRQFKREKSVGYPAHLAFAVDGRSLLTLMDGMVRIREIASGADRLQIPPVPGSLSALAYSSDTRFVASGKVDGRIFVYSAVSGKQLAQWQGKQGYVYALAFSRDGRFLASGGNNGTILIWKVPEDDSAPVVRNAEEAASLWQTLGDSDAARANRARAHLTASSARALPLIKEYFLRALGKSPSPEHLAHLIADLDDDAFKVREHVTRQLSEIGLDAADALRAALDNDSSPEVKRRIEMLLNRLKKGGYSERLRGLRAIEVLERIGTPQAEDLLRELAAKELSAELRQEVQASLRRLSEPLPKSDE